MAPRAFLALALFSSFAASQQASPLPSASAAPPLPALYIHGVFDSADCSGTPSASVTLPLGTCKAVGASTTLSAPAVYAKASLPFGTSASAVMEPCQFSVGGGYPVGYACFGVNVCTFTDAACTASLTSCEYMHPDTASYTCAPFFKYSYDPAVNNYVSRTVSFSAMSAPWPSPSPAPPTPSWGGGGSRVAFTLDPARYAAACAISLVFSAGLSAIVFAATRACRPTAPPSAAAKVWTRRAVLAHRVMYAAHVLLLTGVLTGVASLSALWASINALPPEKQPPAWQLVSAASGTVWAFLALLCLLLPATVLAGVAATRLGRLAAFGELPPGGCCVPSAPAIQGLAWTGALLNLVAGLAGLMLSSFSLALDAFSTACIFVGAVLASVAGCCVMGPLPGLGAARTNACCAEPALDADADAGGLASAQTVTADDELVVRAPAKAAPAPAPVSAGSGASEAGVTGQSKPIV